MNKKILKALKKAIEKWEKYYNIRECERR